MSKENTIEKLKDLIMNNNATQSDWNEAQRQIRVFLEEKALREKKSAEAQRIAEIENNKPKNAVPRLFRYRHVQQNAQDLLKYCQICSLSELEAYTDELSLGLHKNDFPSTTEAIVYLRERINDRKPKDPNAQKIKLLQETKVELKNNKTGIEEVQQQLKDTQKALNEVKGQLTGDNPERAKEYTT
jgi:hypothetical protein